MLSLLLLGGCAFFNPTSDTSLSVKTPSPTAESPAQAPTDTGDETNGAALSDTVVVPGERVGPITPDTSHDELVERFGEDVLQDEEVSIGEGFTKPGTTVNLGEARSFSIVWTDESRTQPEEIRNLGSAWKTPEGIGVGTSFNELEQQLGEFELYGLGWDYGGTVALEDSDLSQYQDLLILRLQPTPEAAKSDASAFQAVTGDTLFSSDNPNFQQLDLTVGEMIVYLNRPEQ
ncbi:hypothetical protein IQ268_01170 [Oculatella sp. LEGE 06141]|nr:hypothetical protein [Oculatella sp. LEGE 06141]